MKNRLNLISENQKLWLALAGFLLIFIGNLFEASVLKIRADITIVNIGSLFLVIGTLQWMFDEGMRAELVRHISETTIGSDRLYRQGLRDCLENSKNIAENEIWETAKTLEIGVHYSNRFIEDNISLIKRRISRNLSTVIFHLDPESQAAKYLEASDSGKSDIGDKTKNLRELVSKEFDNDQLIRVLQHGRVLRYSFIRSDQSIWVRFFTNSAGYAEVPAVRIEPGQGSTYQFFVTDIEKLKDHSNDIKKLR